MRSSTSSRIFIQSIGVGKSEDSENYFFGESDLRFYKEDIMVRNVVGPSGFSKVFLTKLKIMTCLRN